MSKFTINLFNKDKVLIIISFLISFLLQLTPWPKQIYMFRPSWVLLIFIYWLLILPYQINIMFSFFIGIIMDIISGNSYIGTNILVFITLNYIVLWKFNFIKTAALWYQSIIIIILSLIMSIIIFFIEHIINNINFNIEIIWHIFIDGIIWPWILLVMQKIRYNF